MLDMGYMQTIITLLVMQWAAQEVGLMCVLVSICYSILLSDPPPLLWVSSSLSSLLACVAHRPLSLSQCG